MTIIVVDNSLDVTGAFNAVYKNTLNSGNHYIYYIPRTSRLRPVLEAAGITVYTFPIREISRSIINILLYLPVLLRNGFALARIARRHKADWIYQNEVFILSGLVAKIFTRIKVLSHIRVMPSIFPKRIFRIWLQLHDRYASRIASASFVCRDAALNIYPMKQEIMVVYDFIIPAEKLPAFPKSRSTAQFRLLFIGNYTRGKGQDTAVEAVAIVKQKHPGLDISLDCYGGDFGYAPNIAFRKEIGELIKQHGLSEVVSLNGFTDDVEKAIKSHDVLLNLSVAESFSFVVADGLSFGIPVIATRSGGPGELIADQESGWLCNFSAEEIAAAIYTLATDENLWQKVGAGGHQRIRSLVADFGGSERFQKMFSEA